MIQQLCDNIRNGINCWNTGTNAWLRYVVYERMEKYEKYKTLCTFLLSAIWHGFYPGYYLCFTTAAITVSAARNVSIFQSISNYIGSNGTLQKKNAGYSCISGTENNSTIFFE